MQPEEIERLIEAGLANSRSLMSKAMAPILPPGRSSPAFAGKSRIQKQQMVYDTVRKQLLDGTLHAFQSRPLRLKNGKQLIMPKKVIGMEKLIIKGNIP